MDEQKTNQAEGRTKPHLAQNFYFDHKNVANLERFVNQFGQIENSHRSPYNREKPALRAREQKRLSRAIKRARFLALMPFVKKDTGN